MMKNKKNKIIRIIGYGYFLIFSLYVVFLKKICPNQVILSNGLFAVFAGIMMGYGIDYKNMNIKKRVQHIGIWILYSIIMYCFWMYK